MKHAPGPVCDSCEEKLKTAHPDLAEWYRGKVKKLFPDCHISWAYRGKEDQDKAVAEGKSKKCFPNSAHNAQNGFQAPCSKALDLFQLNPKGQALWPWSWFAQIEQMATHDGDPILWGGVWKDLGDADHFQLKAT